MKRPPPNPNLITAVEAKLEIAALRAQLAAAFDRVIDIFKAEVAGSLTPPELCIRTWVPALIARWLGEVHIAVWKGEWLTAYIRARENASAPAKLEIDYDNLDMLNRLAGYECMRSFYQEMFRKTRGDPATIEGEDADTIARTAYGEERSK